ncbi:hypothetical protein O181_116857 [Austropuccinia psidii MF-1]|uniref:Uncharacterized protein n=1 Tax=Austropuccinia psidii MF-1 TaxID=1389203 RepID=A0A9Q3KC95_9BASI|nr:hypothetical protein [Austropuccinia psidii MF-1]
MEQVPEEESPIEDSQSHSMGDSIREQYVDKQDPTEEFIVEYQKETQIEDLDMHVTATSLTLLLDGCGNPTWSQVGANWPSHIFYGQLAPLGVYGIHAITPSNGHFIPSGHILPPLALLANSYFTNPQAFIFHFGPVGVIWSSRGLQAP